MRWEPNIRAPKLRHVALPVALATALGSGYAGVKLVEFEGNVMAVYADHIAGGLPTFCAGRTDWSAPVGATVSEEDCKQVNKITIAEYGYSVLACTKWEHLSGYRTIALTLFAINVGKAGACGSRAVALINEGKIAEGCEAMAHSPSGRPQWSYSRGKFVQGLYNRRLKERDICLLEGGPTDA